MGKFVSIRCILVIWVAINWEIHQMVVNATSFNEVLEVELYMDLSEEFVQEEKTILCANSQKTIYGLKQLPRV